MDEMIRQMAVQMQTILDSEPDSPAPAASIYIHERYRSPRDSYGLRLVDLRDREAKDAGYHAAMEFRRNYMKRASARFRRRFSTGGLEKTEVPPELQEGMSNAERRGRSDYLVRFVLDEMAVVSDATFLHDLGIYLQRITRGVVREEELTSIIRDVAEALSNRGEPLDLLAPMILGMARARSHDPGTNAESDWAGVDGVINGLSAGGEMIKAGIRRALLREAQEKQDHREALERARQTRYRRAADFLAEQVTQQNLNPDQAVELVAQVILRTSEGFQLADEFRTTLNNRFSDPEFGSRVAKRIIELASEKARMHDEIDWNAARRGVNAV